MGAAVVKLTDYFVLGMVSAAWVASTVYLFLHPTDTNFATWGALAATMGGIYHWITVYDDKRPDCDKS